MGRFSDLLVERRLRQLHDELSLDVGRQLGFLVCDVDGRQLGRLVFDVDVHRVGGHERDHRHDSHGDGRLIGRRRRAGRLLGRRRDGQLRDGRRLVALCLDRLRGRLLGRRGRLVLLRRS
jgi:hypothetical protein